MTPFQGRLHRRLLTLAVAACVAFCVGSASAQPDFPTRPTGTIDVVLAGQPHAFHTYATDIPENVAEGIEDPTLRERLERAAGTTEHTATWNVPEPVVMGGVVLMAVNDMYVAIYGRASEDRDAGLGELRIDFGLGLTTLTVSDPAVVGISVRYYPESFSIADYYELTEGGLEIASVERVDDHTLRIQGTFAGTFSFQTRPGVVEHNPNDTLATSGRFDILHVVGKQPLADVLISPAGE
jgi:hypothetical protein